MFKLGLKVGRCFLQLARYWTFTAIKTFLSNMTHRYLLPTLLLLSFPLLLFSQLVGKITDEQGEGLPYVSVYVHNTTNGTASNASGDYKLALAPGKYDVVFQYVGYKQETQTVNIKAGKPTRLNVRLEPAVMELGEVTITDEDPAVRIMRQVIAKRKYYRDLVNESSCDVYIKGLHKMMDSPKKIFGKDVGDMEGALDSSGTGVLYLSESVSKLYVQRNPHREKEEMISSKVSGQDGGFNLNRATITGFDLYEERLVIDREILSPLADNAFNYYNFKLVGKYTDANNYDIYKIAVLPRRPADPTFSGFLYVVSDWWNLSGVDLALTGASIKQPILDTLRFVQSFVPVQQPDVWRLVSQVTSYRFGIFGFQIGGFFNCVLSNYNLAPHFDPDFFDREVFKIEQQATQRDSAYWSETRPMPLTEEEAKDYVEKDSIQRVHKSKAYLDSVDRKDNRLRIMKLLQGYSWNDSYHNTRISLNPAILWLQYNTVQGRLINIHPEFVRYDEGERRSEFWRADGTFNYGFSEKQVRGWGGISRRFESINYSTAEISGGKKTEQFDPENPISVLYNASYSLFFRRNYLKIYDKTFLKAGWSQMVWNTVLLRASAEYADRRALVNHDDRSWVKYENREFFSNNPLDPEGPDTAAFRRNQAMTLDVSLRFRIGQEYSTYPKFRLYHSSDWPDFFVHYRGAIPNVAGSDADYNLAWLEIRQQGLSWGLAGQTNWKVSAGRFLTHKRVEFMDFYHPLANQIALVSPQHFSEGFLLLPYYRYSTDRAFVEAHVQHHMQGWLLDKIPGVRKLAWKEVLSLNFYWTDHPALQEEPAQKLPYWEAGLGFENVGILFLRFLRVDVVSGFFGGKYYRTGVVVGVNLNGLSF